MRWKLTPGDPDSVTLDGDRDRIVVDDLEGEDHPLSCIGEIGLFLAERNARSGYDVDVKGSCNKAPQGINWGPITIVLEEPATPELRSHLERIWGPEGETLANKRDAHDAVAALAWL